ncbi:MAG: macro domain-containing protein [Clostridia bacterium]|nr:macro domain-containing protein [Clostridia bacterium]
MPFQIIRNDITKVKADAIVNTANPMPCIGSGTDSAVYAAAGEAQLLAERKKIGEIAPGEVACTPAFRLQAQYILHTVGPVWMGGNRGEREILRSCYAKSLALAAQLKCESIAFPLIASGVYGFPKDEALNIALSEIGKFLLTGEMKVLLVVLDRRALELSESLVGSIEQYIDEHEARSVREAEYKGAGPQERRRLEAARRYNERKALSIDGPGAEETAEEDVLFAAPMLKEDSLPVFAGKSLEDVLDKAGDSFRQKLFKLIDESGMDDVTVYKKANIDRKVFSSIRCKKKYKPKKETALAFAIALRLDMPATLDLLSRAGFTFSPSDRFDLIVAYFITNGKYDIFEINAALFRYGERILG